MADRTKFEKMLELLINEDREGAEALFHEIVVEKSRDIYESLLEDDAEIEEGRFKDAVTDMQERLHDFAQEIQKGMHSYDNVVDELNDMFDEVKDMGDPIVTNAFKVLRTLEPEDFGEGEGGGPNRASSVAQDVMDIIDGDDDDDYDHLPSLEGYDNESVESELEEGATKSSMMKDAEKMSKAAFIKKYGKENADTWSNINESDDDDVDEGFNLDEFEVEADPMSMMGGDATDDMMGDVDMDAGGDDMGMDMDMDMGDGGDVNDRMDDLEDALEALKAEFEAMMGGEGEEEEEEEEEEEGEEDEMPNKESFAPAFEAKAQKKDDKKAKKSATEEMREYVEKIGGQTYNSFGKMGDNGANTKSIVAKPNNMGGTSANIVNTGTEKSPVEANKGQLKGNGLLKGSPKDMSTKNVNVPGGKAGVKHLSKQSGGGLDNNSILKTDHSDKSAQSTLNKVSTRAK